MIEGGASQWTMTTPDGLTKHGRLRFKTIDSPRLFVYAQNFTDEDGKPARLPIAAPYPETLLTTVRFARLGAERTCGGCGAHQHQAHRAQEQRAAERAHHRPATTMQRRGRAVLEPFRREFRGRDVLPPSDVLECRVEGEALILVAARQERAAFVLSSVAAPGAVVTRR